MRESLLRRLTLINRNISDLVEEVAAVANELVELEIACTPEKVKAQWKQRSDTLKKTASRRKKTAPRKVA